MPKSRIDLLGVKVDAITMTEAADAILRLTSQPKAVYVVKPYVEFLTRAVKDPEVRNLLNDAALTLPDGVALAWAAYYLNLPKRNILRWKISVLEILTRPGRIYSVLPERFGGTDFTLKLLARAEATKKSVFLVGSPKKQSIDQTATAIARRFPSLIICGTASGQIPNEAAEQKLLEQLLKYEPDIILVGIGFPRQERLMSRLAPQLGHGVLIGEGGSFDFDVLGGKLVKAPAWVGRIGLEWFWRLAREPWRIGRQLSILNFMWLVYRAGQKQNGSHKS